MPKRRLRYVPRSGLALLQRQLCSQGRSPRMRVSLHLRSAVSTAPSAMTYMVRRAARHPIGRAALATPVATAFQVLALADTTVERSSNWPPDSPCGAPPRERLAGGVGHSGGSRVRGHMPTGHVAVRASTDYGDSVSRPSYLQSRAAAAHCCWNASAVADECALAGHRSRDAPRYANVPLGVLSWAYRPMRMSCNSAPVFFAAMRWNGGYVFRMPMDRIIGDAARNALAVHNWCRIGNSYERLRIH